MIRNSIGIAFIFLMSIMCSQAYAAHIQYVDLADISTAVIGAGDTWTWTFDLVEDDMYLFEIDTPTETYGPTPDVDDADYIGSYDPLYDLHYVTLRIDPNNYTGDPTSGYIALEVNGIEIDDWENPISLYSWGVPDGTVSDLYGIASEDYQITVTLTGLQALENAEISIYNINLEGCFDSTVPVPEPTTMLLLGSGLAGLAGFRRKFKKA